MSEAGGSLGSRSEVRGQRGVKRDILTLGTKKEGVCVHVSVRLLVLKVLVHVYMSMYVHFCTHDPFLNFQM